MKNYGLSAQKWATNLASASAAQAYSAGIDSYTGNPMQAAATPDAEALYLAKVTDAVNSGRRSAKLSSLPRDAWATPAKNFGASNLKNGAQKALGKMTAHFAKWGPIYGQVSQAVAGMPKGTRQASINRFTTAMDMLKAAAGKS